MRRWNNGSLGRLLSALRNERGSATLEFLGLGVLLLVPIAYGMLTLAELEQALFAAELAARNGARTLASEGIPSLANTHAASQIEWALRDHGIDPHSAVTTLTCTPNPDCAVTGDSLTLTVELTVQLPLLPGEGAMSIPVEATATFPRARFEVTP